MKRNFDYACDNCGYEEADIIAEEKEEVKCPKCGSSMRHTYTGCGKFAMKGKFTAKNSYGLKG